MATSAYQIEGAVAEDGRGPSIWDTFPQVETAATACDHYHRSAADVDLMAGLGIDSYRFSIAWPRIQPSGSGPANGKGLDFYEQLVDGLLARGITPVPTLYHWDLPQALEDKGGWLDRDTAYRFAEYAYLVADRLADRVDTWLTLNEPVVTMAYGYAFGIYAPGKTLLLDALPTAHHQLLAHGLATTALRGKCVDKIGIANHYIPAWPASDAPEDMAATAAFDTLINKLFTDPLLLGEYPDLSALGPLDLSFIRDEDLKVISQPIDLLGVNYYQPNMIGSQPGGALPFDILPIEGYPITSNGWPVVPDAFRDLLTGLKTTYGDALPPILITENGCSYGPGLDDQERIKFLDSHLKAVGEAQAAGVDVQGYFVWSLMDNYEWSYGYEPRFGLVHIDYETLERTPRSSYHWYRDHIAARRA